MKKIKLLCWLKTNRVRLAIGAALLGLTAITLLIGADRACARAANGRLFRSLATVPAREVGLVLGCGQRTSHGKPNPHFTHRIETAAALYHAGKVRHLLVSGDNHIASYDEPDDMRAALVAAGVSARAITCDYAGFHTLDSVVRAKEIFGLSQCTIISEEFHCPRALWIAQRHGLDAIAFSAPDVGLKSWSLRADIREQLARSWCAVDLYLLHRGPKFLGKKEPILAGVKALAVTMQLARSCLLDLFAQALRRSALTDPWRICSRLTPRLAQKSASHPLSSQLHSYGLASLAFNHPFTFVPS